MLDARWIILGAAMVNGREDRIGRFARVFRALPVPPGPQPPAQRPESGVAVRSRSVGGRSYVEMANDTPYTIWVDTVLRTPASAEVDDLGRGLTLEPQAVAGGKRLVIELRPFGVAALRVGSPDLVLDGITPHLQDDLKPLHNALLARLERLSQGGGLGGPPNPTFEPSGPHTTLTAEIKAAMRATPPPTGWSLVGGDPESALTIDPEHPHRGQGSLRLDAHDAPASAASDPFIPPAGGSLLLESWLRTDRPESKVRVWLEGEAGGKAVTRRTEVAIGTDWFGLKVRAPDLPEPGLDQLRLRFELLEPGALWIDDLSVAGQGPSEHDRRAERLLVTAMQAYREKRYADFARLVGSLRARLPESDLVPAPSPIAERPDPLRTGDAAPTGLPPGRRLR